MLGEDAAKAIQAFQQWQNSLPLLLRMLVPDPQSPFAGGIGGSITSMVPKLPGPAFERLPGPLTESIRGVLHNVARSPQAMEQLPLWYKAGFENFLKALEKVNMSRYIAGITSRVSDKDAMGRLTKDMSNALLPAKFGGEFEIAAPTTDMVNRIGDIFGHSYTGQAIR